MIEEEIYEAQENPPSAYIDGKSLAVFVAVCLEQITFFCELKTATFAFLSSQTWNTRESLRQQRWTDYDNLKS